MKRSILISATILFMVASQGFGVDFSDGGTHNIDYAMYGDVTVDYQAPGMQTTVNLLAGGDMHRGFVYDDKGNDVAYYGSAILKGYNNSRLNVSGGSVEEVVAYDSSQVTMSGGSVQFGLSTYGSSQATISDGALESCGAYNSSQITISGGTLSFCGFACDSSQITMSGGRALALYGYNSGQITLSGGTVSDVVVALDSSQVTMSGGRADILAAVATGQAILSGGHVNNLCAENGGQIAIYGSYFTIDGNPVNFGKITSMFGGTDGGVNYIAEPYRTLTGTLANGNGINAQFQIYDLASITLVEAMPAPEPATLLLLGVGAVILRKHRS
jgi:hypothetical protein